MEIGYESFRSKRLGWVIRYTGIALILVLFIALLLSSPMTTRWVDFPVYWVAGQKAIQGHTVYDVAGHFQYKYSPLIALIFGKLYSFLTFETASWIHQKTMLLIWAFLFWRASKGKVGVLLLLLLFFGNALRLDLQLGQVNALVLGLLWFLFERLERKGNWGNDLLFGVVFSLAIQLKLFALILVPVLVFRGEWRKLLLGMALLAFSSVFGVGLYSGSSFAISENLAWVRSLTASTDELLLNEQNVGLLGTFAKALGLSIAKPLWIASGVTFVAFLWSWRRRPLPWIRNVSLSAIAFLNPLVWSYWILFLLPLAGEVFSSKEFRGRFDLRRGFVNLPQLIPHLFAFLFIFAAFTGQHARWAWNGGIFFAMVILVGWSFRWASTMETLQNRNVP